jgi:hypothetical protein
MAEQTVKMTESRRVVGVWGVDRLDQARVGSIKAWLGPGRGVNAGTLVNMGRGWLRLVWGSVVWAP